LQSARAWSAGRRRARSQTDGAAFDALMRTLGTDDPLTSYRALHAWTRRAHASGLAAWCIATNDAELLQEITALERVLFANAGGPRWRGARLAGALQRMQRTPPRVLRRALPPLSPPAHDLHE